MTALRLLLDTHIWLWSVLEPARLAPRVVTAMRAEENELWLSPFSVWEALMLIERSRIVVDGDAAGWIERATTAAPFREAPFTFEVAVESRRVGLTHADPVDRFLAATARVLDLHLVTADARLASCPGVRILPNRAR